MMKKIFITGASSYLGRNVIEKFKDYEFIALINNKDVEYKNVKNLRIDSFNEIKDIFEEESFDYVFHFASQRHTQDDINGQLPLQPNYYSPVWPTREERK